MTYNSIPNKYVLNSPGVFGHAESADINGKYEPSTKKSVPTTEMAVL